MYLIFHVFNNNKSFQSVLIFMTSDKFTTKSYIQTYTHELGSDFAHHIEDIINSIAS